MTNEELTLEAQIASEAMAQGEFIEIDDDLAEFMGLFDNEEISVDEL